MKTKILTDIEKFTKNQPRPEDFMGLQLVFYTLHLYELKKKCKFKLTFIKIFLMDVK